MDNRPIGVFDSGLGGLTAVRELQKILPNEEIIYFGDTARVPYGTKADETIVQYARQDMNFLMNFDPKYVLIACGTVSTVALKVIKDEYTVPIEGVVLPAADAALKQTKNGIIGVIGTNATIRSGEFNRVLTSKKKVQIVTEACPLFVPLVENARTDPEDIVVKEVVKGYLEKIRESGADTLILGCTHYPLLEVPISRYLGDHVNLISPGREAALVIAEKLSQKDSCAEKNKKGNVRYFVSDGVSSFCESAEIFLGKSISEHVECVRVG